MNKKIFVFIILFTVLQQINLYKTHSAQTTQDGNKSTANEKSNGDNKYNELRTIKVTEELLKKWKDTLEFGISSQRIKILQAIKSYNDPKTYALITNTIKNDVSSKVRKQAVQIAIDLKYKPAATEIAKLLKEDDNELKQRVLYALGELDYKKANKEIIKFIEAQSSAVKISALKAAGKLKIKKALPEIHKLAKSMETSDNVKEAAIVAIGEIGDKKSIPVLNKIFDNPAYNKYVRMYCVTALGMIGDKKSFEYIKKAFNSNEFFIKLRAVDAMGRIDHTETYKYLKAALRHDKEKIRLQALNSVSMKKNNKKYFQQLKYMIKNETSSKVKKRAVLTFVKIGGNEAINFVKKQIEKPGNHFLKYYIVLGLEKIEDKESVPMLVKIYKENKSGDLRNSIIRTLGNIKTDKAISALKDFLFYDEKGNKAESRKHKQKILSLLVGLRPDESAGILKKIIYKSDDIWVKIHATRLLGALTGKQGHSVVEDLVKSKDIKPRIQIEAIRMAGKLQIMSLKDELKKMMFKTTNQYKIYVIKRAMVRLGEDGANIDAELKKHRNQKQSARYKAKRKKQLEKNKPKEEKKENTTGKPKVPKKFNQ